MKRFSFLLFLILTTISLNAAFTDIYATLEGITSCSVSWGDYDNDGDLDVVMIGNNSSLVPVSKIYNNDSGVFTDINAGMEGVYSGSVVWGDYDNDDDLDILLTGKNVSEAPVTRLYRNDYGIFSNVNTSMENVWLSSAKWADYDNDGDLDILLTGRNANNAPVTKIYRNENESFVDINAAITQMDRSSVSWADYDKDGDLDVLLAGHTGTYGPKSLIFRNDSGIFTDIGANLADASGGSVSWGDYDNDGDPDIILSGYDDPNIPSIIYRNDNGIFVDINAGLQGHHSGAVDWGDYDNDGDLDVFINGFYADPRYCETCVTSKVYRNNSGIFSDINAGLISVSGDDNSCGWADYDNDGDLDLHITGSYPMFTSINKIYRNDTSISNSMPNSPTKLKSVVVDNNVTLSWRETTDNETPSAGLSYNVYIGTSGKTGDILNPMSDIDCGYRKIVDIGNSGQRTSVSINDLPEGTYFWSVQAIDHAYAGSLFASEEIFYVGELYAPANVKIDSLTNSIHISWTEVAGASSYKIYASDYPYNNFTEVTSGGVFDGLTWSQPIVADRKFYYVVAANSVKKE
ncbi:MAG TPA: VCBS repeat-containing protein [Clostridiales bacterium]|nr:VCBS repeat-containing protein [Clostridiales bacterium]